MDMAACRSCYGEENNYDHEHYSAKESCSDVCVTDGMNVPLTGMALGGLFCGHYPQVFDMMSQMLNSQECYQNITWSLKDFNIDPNSRFEQRACEPFDECCITSTPKTARITSAADKGDVNGVLDMNSNLPGSTSWWNCQTNYQGRCEVCAGGGLGVNHFSCLKKTLSDKTYIKNVINCNSGYYVASNDAQHYEERKECDGADGCCRRITNNQLRPSILDPTYLRCNSLCQLHIDRISLVSRKIYNWATWYDQTDFLEGILVGGHLCHVKLRTGLFLLLPIALTWLVVFCHWIQHYREGKTTKKTFMFGTTMTYPIFCNLKQRIWRTIVLEMSKGNVNVDNCSPS